MMRFSYILLLAGVEAFVLSPLSGFKPNLPALRQGHSARNSLSSLSMMENPSRREALGSFSAAALSLLLTSQKANAAGLAFGYGTSLNQINDALASYGLSTKSKVADGFKPLIQLVGGSAGANIDGSKTIESIGSILTENGLKTGEKVLLVFDYPSAWIISLPVSTANGESGTVSANNYVKGDSAVVGAKTVGDGKLADQTKEFFQDLMMQSVPKDQWQNFKLVKKTESEAVDGQEAIAIEYRYDLITSGPIIGRHGFAKVIHVGKSAVSLGANTLDTRFKKMKDDLVTSTSSFRAHIVKAELTK